VLPETPSTEDPSRAESLPERWEVQGGLGERFKEGRVRGKSEG
jgi:hypothetical protein